MKKRLIQIECEKFQGKLYFSGQTLFILIQWKISGQTLFFRAIFNRREPHGRADGLAPLSARLQVPC